MKGVSNPSSHYEIRRSIADGTYMYKEKRGDYSFQRRSYSAHKGRRLFKQIMLLATDSFILHVLSPHFVDDQIQTLTSRAIMRISKVGSVAMFSLLIGGSEM